MYTFIVVVLMLVLPALCILAERVLAHRAISLALVGRWFIFWAVGVRLFLAGIRQILQPEYTAQTILGLQHLESHILVRELGFANLAIGLVALLTLFARVWTLPVALVAGIFFGLAGANHLLHGARDQLQNVAMASDIFAAIVLLSYCATSILQQRRSARIDD